MIFLTPRYVKEGRELLEAARKALAYRRDLMADVDVQLAQQLQDELREALRSRDRAHARAASEALKRFCDGHFPVLKHPVVSENVEVFLVAIVIALAIRTFFFQPFTIPTGSMQPTLNGVLVYKLEAPMPNILQRAVEYAVLGRNYFEITPETNDTIQGFSEITRFYFFRSTIIHGTRQQNKPRRMQVIWTELGWLLFGKHSPIA